MQSARDCIVGNPPHSILFLHLFRPARRSRPRFSAFPPSIEEEDENEDEEDCYASGVTPITTSNFAASSLAREFFSGAKSTVTDSRAFGSVMFFQMPSRSFPGWPLM